MSDEMMQRVLFLIPLILSLSVHEWAHAWSAWLLGDDTAAAEGRMTLNPLSHIDPIGTLLLPLMGVPFGWAKPVPVNPLRFRRDITMRKGMLIVAAAGPISNVIIAGVCLGLLVLSTRVTIPQSLAATPDLLFTLVTLNVILAVFNMFPVPPLDGSKVADSLMPERFRPMWDRFCDFGPVALIAVILIPNLLGFGPIQWALDLTSRLMGQLGIFG